MKDGPELGSGDSAEARISMIHLRDLAPGTGMTWTRIRRLSTNNHLASQTPTVRRITMRGRSALMVSLMVEIATLRLPHVIVDTAPETSPLRTLTVCHNHRLVTPMLVGPASGSEEAVHPRNSTIQTLDPVCPPGTSLHHPCGMSTRATRLVSTSSARRVKKLDGAVPMCTTHASMRTTMCEVVHLGGSTTMLPEAAGHVGR